MENRVWVVVGNLGYEGDWVEGSCEVFFKYEDAVEYGEELKRENMFEDYSIKGCVVK